MGIKHLLCFGFRRSVLLKRTLERLIHILDLMALLVADQGTISQHLTIPQEIIRNSTFLILVPVIEMFSGSENALWFCGGVVGVAGTRLMPKDLF